MTLAFSGGCSFPGVRHGTDDNRWELHRISRSRSCAGAPSRGMDGEQLFGFDTENVWVQMMDWATQQLKNHPWNSKIKPLKEINSFTDEAQQRTATGKQEWLHVNHCENVLLFIWSTLNLQCINFKLWYNSSLYKESSVAHAFDAKSQSAP